MSCSFSFIKNPIDVKIDGIFQAIEKQPENFCDEKIAQNRFFLCEGRTLNFFFLKEKVAKRSKRLTVA